MGGLLSGLDGLDFALPTANNASAAAAPEPQAERPS